MKPFVSLWGEALTCRGGEMFIFGREVAPEPFNGDNCLTVFEETKKRYLGLLKGAFANWAAFTSHPDADNFLQAIATFHNTLLALYHPLTHILCSIIRRTSTDRVQ